MNCRDVRERLAARFDSRESPLGETGIDRFEAKQRPIESHLEDCADCRRAAERLLEVERRLSALPVEIEPDRDLWPGISARLDRETGSLRRYTLPVAAAVLVAAGLGVAAWQLLGPGLPGTSPSAGLEAEADLQGSSDAEALTLEVAADLARYEDRTLETRRDLLTVVARHEARLDHELSSAIAADVQSLHEAIGEIRLALRERPEDRRLNLLLAAKFQQEAELLKRLSHI